jgi:hypothetical protein
MAEQEPVKIGKTGIKIMLGLFIAFVLYIMYLANGDEQNAKKEAAAKATSTTTTKAPKATTTSSTVAPISTAAMSTVSRWVDLQAKSAATVEQSGKAVIVKTALYPKEENGRTAVGICNSAWWGLQEAGLPTYRVSVKASDGEKELAATLTNPNDRNGLAPCDDTSGMDSWKRAANTETGEWK